MKMIDADEWVVSCIKDAIMGDPDVEEVALKDVKITSKWLDDNTFRSCVDCGNSVAIAATFIINYIEKYTRKNSIWDISYMAHRIWHELEESGECITLKYPELGCHLGVLLDKAKDNSIEVIIENR